MTDVLARNSPTLPIHLFLINTPTSSSLIVIQPMYEHPRSLSQALTENVLGINALVYGTIGVSGMMCSKSRSGSIKVGLFPGVGANLATTFLITSTSLMHITLTSSILSPFPLRRTSTTQF